MSIVDQSVSYFNPITKTTETKAEQQFTFDEDVAICEAILSALEDLRDGSLEQSDLYNAVFERFVASTKNESRSQDFVQTRLEKIMTSCFKFHAYFTRIRHECQKGLTESQMAHQAKFLYVEYERHPFVLDHCWEILQHRIRWEAMAETKKPNSPAKTSESIEQLLDASFPSQEFNHKTCRDCNHSPINQGKAKAAVLDQLESPQMDDSLEQLNKQARKAEKWKDQSEEKRLRLMKRMQEIEEKQVEAKEQERDDGIMLMDTSKMDHQQQLYWAIRRGEIISKTFNRLNVLG